MNKKLFVFLLALTLVFAVSAPAFAAGVGSESGTVGVVIDADNDGIPDDVDPQVDPSATVYSVKVTWESLDFMYSGIWDPDSAKYTGSWKTETDGAWIADDTQNITVENRSNGAVTVSATMDTTTKNGVSAALSANATGVVLGSAAEAGAIVNNVGPSTVFTVTVSGNPTVTEAFDVGQITVAFSSN